MGACGCVGRDQYNEIIKSFYQTLPIRNKSPMVYNEALIEHINKDFTNDENIFLTQILEVFLINSDHTNLSQNMFMEAFRYYLKTNELFEFLIALLFLTQSDKAACKVTFKKIVKFYKPDSIIIFDHFNNTFCSDTTSHNSTCERKTFIKCDELFNILKVYVDLISNFSVKYLDQLLKNNGGDFKKELMSQYCEENQIIFINKHIGTSDNILITLDDFFANEYDNFCDDNYVREELSRIDFENNRKNEKTT